MIRAISGSFGARPSEVARARRMSTAALRSWGMDGDVPAMELAVSELVAHAIRGGEGVAKMRLSAEGDTICLEVADIDAERRRLPALDGPSGRSAGLWFVDEVADDWGVDRRPDGTRMWLVRRRTGGV